MVRSSRCLPGAGGSTVTKGVEVEGEPAENYLDWRPAAGFWYTVTKSPRVTGEDELVMEGGLEPGHDGPPVHTHRNMEETFKVLSGTLDVWIDGTWTELKAGETYTVPPGGYHAARNHHPERAEIVHIHRPAGRMEDFFRVFCELVRSGKVKKVPPKDPRGFFLMAMLFDAYREDIELLKPPPRVFKTVASVGKGLGYKLPPVPD